MNPQATSERPLSEIVQEMMRNLGEIIRSEIRLARAEITESVTNAKRAGMLMGVAAILGLLGAFALVGACVAALSLVLPVWAASIIVSVALLLLAFLMFAAGRAHLREVTAPKKTMETIKEDVEWAKHHTKSNSESNKHEAA